MLTLEQFNALDKSEQIQLLEDFGEHLEIFHRSHGCKVALFEMWGRFYVEVWLHERKDTFIKIEGFEDYRKLDPFIRDVDLDTLLTF